MPCASITVASRRSRANWASSLLAETTAAYQRLRSGGADETGAERPQTASLVGRSAERRILFDRWRAALDGSPSLALLTGEAGIGKTALAEDLRAWCARHGAVTAEARSYAAEGELVYGPLTGWLRAPTIRPVVQQLTPQQCAELSRILPELSRR